jgi:Late exocytosis, associated with Golgi transport
MVYYHFPKVYLLINCNRQSNFCFDSLKIFIPITVLALLILIPVNVSGGTLLNLKKEVMFSDIDKLSISNVSPGSKR